MRIVAEIPHPRMKITVFKMNDKLSVKFEKNLIESILKFREDSPLQNLDKLKEAINNEVLHSIELQLQQTAELKDRTESNYFEANELDQFDEII